MIKIKSLLNEFHTDNNIPPSNKQLKYLKDYCIEHNLRLIQSLGLRHKEIEL
jgi:hypothetical protein